MIKKKLWGIDLYIKKHKNCGFYKGKKNHKCNCPKPLHLLKPQMKKGEIKFHSNYKGYRYFGILPRDDYMKLVKKDKNLFEVIDRDTARRVYFDVDGTQKECFSEAIKEIKNVFGDDVSMVISGSETQKNKKPYFSYHIILNDIVFIMVL